MDNIGHLLWFDVFNDIQVTYDELAGMFHELHLDPAYLPRDKQPASNAYRAAARAVRIKYATPWRKDHYAVVHLEPVGETAREVEHKIMRKLLRISSKELRFRHGKTKVEQIGEVLFYRKTSKLPNRIRIVLFKHGNVIHDKERPILTKAMLAMEEDYSRRLTHYNNNKIRTILRRILDEQLHATLVKVSGGVYFIPASDTADILLPRLGAFIQQLRETTTVHWIPVNDAGVVLPHLRRSVQSQVGELTEEINNLPEDVSPDKIRQLTEKYRNCAARVAAHASVMTVPDDIAQTIADALERIEVVQQMIKE